MICIGIDPGTCHCAFTVVESKSYLELQDDTFVEKTFADQFTVLESSTIPTVSTDKASIKELTTTTVGHLDELLKRYKSAILAVEIQPFTGGSTGKRGYITRQSLLNVSVECCIVTFATTRNIQLKRIQANSWQKHFNVTAKSKSFKYYTENIPKMYFRCNTEQLANEHEFDGLLLAIYGFSSD